MGTTPRNSLPGRFRPLALACEAGASRRGQQCEEEGYIMKRLRSLWAMLALMIAIGMAASVMFSPGAIA